MTNNIYFIANWKMYGNLNSLNSVKKVIELSKKKKFKNTNIIYCPPYTLLNDFSKLTKKTRVKVGAQNCHEFEFSGPFTGSVSPHMIASLGVKLEVNSILAIPLIEVEFSCSNIHWLDGGQTDCPIGIPCT